MASKSTEALGTLLWIGIGLQVCGGFTLGVTAGMVAEDVTWIGDVLGFLLVGIGSLMVVIGSVGWGVLLGLRARDAERRTTVDVGR